MKSLTFEAVKCLLNSPKKTVVVPHVNPDGDAIGSALGLCQYLIQKGHKACVIVPNDYPKFLKWMPGTNEILNYELNMEMGIKKLEAADLIFTVDFNALHRSGPMQTELEKNKTPKIMIDHHQQPEDYASFKYSDPEMGSTAEMIYHFIDQLGDLELINKEVGIGLYTGIMTDTASFRYPKTSGETHRIAAHLIELGINHSEIHSKIYDANRFERLKLMGTALSNLIVLKSLNTAYITLSQAELDAFNYQKGDTEGLVNYGLSVGGVKLASIFIEKEAEGCVKISLRSKGDFDVNHFARRHFNGGGHRNAAGGKSNLSLEDTVKKFKAIIKSYKMELQ